MATNPYDSYLQYQKNKLQENPYLGSAGRTIRGVGVPMGRTFTELESYMRREGIAPNVASQVAIDKARTIGEVTGRIGSTARAKEIERKDILGEKIAQTQLQRDIYQEQLDEREKAKKEGFLSAVAGAVGTGIGAIAGRFIPGLGTMAGAQIGGGLGSLFAGANFKSSGDVAAGMMGMMEGFGQISKTATQKKITEELLNIVPMFEGLTTEQMQPYLAMLPMLRESGGIEKLLEMLKENGVTDIGVPR